MARALIDDILLFLLPFAAFGVWLVVRQRSPLRWVHWSDQAARLAIAGAALVILSFVVMALTYFVCGMQLVFLTTHLPSYLSLCGMDPMLSAQALGTIGGFNILGSLFFGWAGQRWNKLALLGGLYITRSIVLSFYFLAPPTPTTTPASSWSRPFATGCNCWPAPSSGCATTARSPATSTPRRWRRR